MMTYHSTSKNNIVRHNISYNFAFGSNSLSFIFLKIYVGNKILYWLSSFFLYLSYFSRFSQKTSQTSQFDHFFAHISGSNGPILLFFELLVSKSCKSLCPHKEPVQCGWSKFRPFPELNRLIAQDSVS